MKVIDALVAIENVLKFVVRQSFLFFYFFPPYKWNVFFNFLFLFPSLLHHHLLPPPSPPSPPPPGKTEVNSQACGNGCISEGLKCTKDHGTACNCEADACNRYCNPEVCLLFFCFLFFVFSLSSSLLLFVVSKFLYFCIFVFFLFFFSHQIELTLFFFLFFVYFFILLTEILPMWQRLHFTV